MLKVLDGAISWLERSKKEVATDAQKRAPKQQQQTQQALQKDIEERRREIREIRELKAMQRSREYGD